MYLICSNRLVNYDIKAIQKTDVFRLSREIYAKRIVTTPKCIRTELTPEDLTEKFAVKGNIVYHGFSEIEYRRGPEIVGIKRTMKTVYQAPVTFTWTAEILGLPVPGNSDYMFLQESLKSDHYKLLASLLENVESRETLYKILEYFDGNEEILREFLRVYHPDLFFFRRLLDVIFLDEVSSEPLKEVQDRLDWARQFGFCDEVREYDTKLQEGKNNTEIAKRLNLQFKKGRPNSTPSKNNNLVYTDGDLPF